MQKNAPSVYFNVVKSLGQLLTVTRLYKLEHPVFKEKLGYVFNEISKLLSEKKSLNFFLSGSILLVNGEEIEAKDSLIKQFAQSFHSLQLGSLSLEPGLTIEEFDIFMRVLYQEQPLQGEDKVKKYLEEKGCKHIIPRSATYKMVQEGEVIVKDGGILKIDEMPADLLNKFVQDFKSAKVGERLREGDENYKILAHNPILLSETTFEIVKDKNSSEDITKILWFIGDYLIDEIGTLEEEELNAKILDDIRNHLIDLFEKKAQKENLKEDAQKTFVAINTVLKLKGLILLYNKHKKNMDKLARKIRKMLKELPADSQAYSKTREKLEKIDIHFFDKPGNNA